MYRGASKGSYRSRVFPKYTRANHLQLMLYDLCHDVQGCEQIFFVFTFKLYYFMQEHNSSKAKRVRAVIDYIKRGSYKTYRGFLYSLSESNQRDVVTGILHESVADLAPTTTSHQVPNKLVGCLA